MVALKFLAGLVLVIVLVIFAQQNFQPQVTIKYYIGKELGPMPFSFAVLGSAVLGSMIAAFATLIEQFRLKRRLRKQEKLIAQMEAELLEFKSQPPLPLPEATFDEEDEDEGEEYQAALPPKPEENRQE